MKQVSGKSLAKAVQRKGWSLARVQGSHHIFVMPGRRERIVIPFAVILSMGSALIYALTNADVARAFDTFVAHARRAR